jgi:hypothetical protein
MIFDPVKRRYIDGSHVLTPKEVRARIDEWIQSEQEQVDQEARAFLEQQKSNLATAAKLLAISSFFAFLANKIRNWHSVAGVLSYGGEAQMNPSRWQRIGQKIDSELTYLRGFEDSVKNSRLATDAITRGISQISTTITEAHISQIESAVIDTSPGEVAKVLEQILVDTVKAEDIAAVIPRDVVDGLAWGEIPGRAGMYAESLYATYENNVVAREVDNGASLGRRVCEEDDQSCDACVEAASTYFEPVEAIPEIGSLTCMTNCRCYFEYAEPNPNLTLAVA